MRLTDFNSDVLLRILKCMDVSSIFSTSQVNKYLHELASTKQLWVWVVSDLVSRGLVDLPPDLALETLTKTALIAEIERVVVGPQTWISGPPTLIRELRRSKAAPDSDTLKSFPRRAIIQNGNPTLLPGGRYIVFSESRRVLFWDLHTGRQAWSWVGTPELIAKEVTYDMQGPSDAVVCQSLFPTGLRNFIPGLRVLKVNLVTGNAIELFDFHIPKMLSSPKVCGDVVTCQFPHGPKSMVLVLNWRTVEFVLFEALLAGWRDYENDSPRLFLRPGHLLLICEDSSRSVHLRVYSMRAFEHLWRSAHTLDLKNPDHESDVPYAEYHLADYTHQDRGALPRINAALDASVIHDDTYDLAIQFCGEGFRPKRDAPSVGLAARLLSYVGLQVGVPALWTRTPDPTTSPSKVTLHYRLTLSPQFQLEPPGLQQKAPLHRDNPYRLSPTAFSSAGYAMYYDAWYAENGVAPRVFTPRGDEARIDLLPVSMMDMAPSAMWLTRSGAVVADYEDVVVISYYL
ncbi:hypothetical protein C8R46DRAFT_1325933 [Mycena filopes]|nr:hypothetical protein C8R46DRAFT_1325933 [Mycena filopes]